MSAQLRSIVSWASQMSWLSGRPQALRRASDERSETSGKSRDSQQNCCTDVRFACLLPLRDNGSETRAMCSTTPPSIRSRRKVLHISYKRQLISVASHRLHQECNAYVSQIGCSTGRTKQMSTERRHTKKKPNVTDTIHTAKPSTQQPRSQNKDKNAPQNARFVDAPHTCADASARAKTPTERRTESSAHKTVAVDHTVVRPRFGPSR